MQYKQRPYKPLTGLFKFLLFGSALLPFAAVAQSTFLQQGAGEYSYLDRREIQLQYDSVLNFSKTKPFSRRFVVEAALRTPANPSGIINPESIETDAVTRYRRHRLFENNLDYLSDSLRENYASKKTFWKSFYKTPANFYEVNQKDFRLIVNPVFQYIVGKEKGSSEHIFLNTRGITLRGNIANKIGFAAYITDNQERDPRYVQEWVTERKAVPGQGFYKDFKGSGYDYFDGRGYISFTASKYIDIVFGYDKNFIGNGYRSLFLSDFSNNALFLKLNTRIWKFNYQNIFMELVNAHRKPADVYLDKKYTVIHHLDMAVTRWLNVGLFEAIVFGRPNHFEFGYLNPVIFYRSIEQQNGSFDNSVAGLDVKANVAKRWQLYGQLLLDELKLGELRNNWWGNKFGYQLGVKYIDAFGVRNLDLQGEWNRVRPFTYSHNDSVANYTHNNQPLAHPLGASFNELIGLLRYQPAPRFTLQAKAIVYKQGRDTNSVNYGSNIFLPNLLRTSEYGFNVGSPAAAKVGYVSLLLSCEFKPNVFVEANAVYRKQRAYHTTPEKNTSVIYLGIRWNMHRREFDF